MLTHQQHLFVGKHSQFSWPDPISHRGLITISLENFCGYQSIHENHKIFHLKQFPI